MIFAATGLKREAALIARPGVQVFACGGHGDVLAARLEAAIAAGRPDGLISIGIAGGLAPGLAVGDLVIGSKVAGHDCDADWVAWLARANPAAVIGVIAGVDTAAATADAKAALPAATGAIAVDMESHIVARLAAAHGLPFAVLRAVSDGADDTLPHAARVPLTDAGGVRMGPVLAAVARRPGEIPALIRLAGNSRTALAALANALTVGAGLPAPD